MSRGARLSETLRKRGLARGVRASRAAIAEPRDLGRGEAARGGCGGQEAASDLWQGAGSGYSFGVL